MGFFNELVHARMMELDNTRVKSAVRKTRRSTK